MEGEPTQPSEESAPIRVGVVGCGGVLWSYGAALRVLIESKQAAIVAMSDIDPARGPIMQKNYGPVRFSTRYEDVVSDDEVDLVLILTSPDVHGEVAIAALEAGKHVLVEKPMAGSLEEAARMVRVARERGLHLVCAPHTILSHTFQVMWKRLRAGEIGDVCLARARYGEADLGWGKWRFTDVPGSGPLFECGVYNVATLAGLLGPATRVIAMGGIAVPEIELDTGALAVERPDTTQLLIDFGGRAYATIATGYWMWGARGPAIELYGTAGAMQMLGEDWAPRGHELLRAGSPAWEFHPEQDPAWHWTDGLPQLVETIRTGGEPLTTPEFAYHVQEIMVRGEESIASGEPRAVESTFPDLRLDPNAINPHERVWRAVAVGSYT